MALLRASGCAGLLPKSCHSAAGFDRKQSSDSCGHRDGHRSHNSTDTVQALFSNAEALSGVPV